MNISDRIFEIMNKKGIKNNVLAEHLNVKPQIITNWKTRGTTPPMEYLPAICEVLGVSWEYLITGTESNEYLLPEEKELIKQFRTLPIEALNEIKKFIEYQIYKCKGEKHES